MFEPGVREAAMQDLPVVFDAVHRYGKALERRGRGNVRVELGLVGGCVVFLLVLVGKSLMS